MSQSIHYLDLINKLAKENKLKQPDLADILKVKPRQYRRMVAKGLSFDHTTKLLLHLGCAIYAIKPQKDCIIQYPLGQ